MFRKLYVHYIRRTFLFELSRSFCRFYFKRKNRQKRLVLITGIASGLGKGLAILFSDLGDTVIGVDIKAENELEDTIKSKLNKYYEFDLAKPGEVGLLLGQIKKNHKCVDILINNAGIMNFNLLASYSDQEVFDMINVKLTSAIMLVKHCLPIMEQNNFGRIINISSTSAFKGEDKFGVYSSINGALILFTESISKLIQNKINCNITVNCIAPHRIATPEYLRNNPEIDQKKLVSIDRVFSKMQKIINSQVSGEVFLIAKFSLRIEYLFRSIFRLYPW